MRFFCICRCSDFAVIQQPYTLVRFHAGCVGSRRRILSLEANRNYSAYLTSHASRSASSLESGDLGITVLFHQPHFVWEQESLGFCHRKPPSLANCPCSSVARFISPAALCLGTRVSSLLTPEAANSCRLALAAP